MGKRINIRLPFLSKNACDIIIYKAIICIFAADFVKKTNKNLIFILLWNVPRATALLCDI
jgi:hypothetical protein